MRKSRNILLFASFFISIMIISNTVSATSWVELEPQEIVDRAEVIITGKYDFTSKPKHRGNGFQGLKFNVKNVYKGDISEQIITAGIDVHDLGWAEEFQNEEGEFLLFLEMSKNADFLVPVGGPNGMIQVHNGKFIGTDDGTFEDYLKLQPEKTFETKFNDDNNSQNNSSNIFLYVIASVLVGLTVMFLLYRYKRKK